MKHLLLFVLLAIAIPIIAQKTAKTHSMIDMMGKPKVDKVVEGVHMKIWVMTQKAHEKMMKANMGHMTMSGEKAEDVDKATKEAMMSGTHAFVVNISDAVSGKELANTTAKVLLVSPTKKNTTVELKTMPNCFGSGIMLDEKGKYEFMVHVNVNGSVKMTKFYFNVK